MTDGNLKSLVILMCEPVKHIKDHNNPVKKKRIVFEITFPLIEWFAYAVFFLITPTVMI
jgi:hypothetical protein